MNVSETLHTIEKSECFSVVAVRGNTSTTGFPLTTKDSVFILFTVPSLVILQLKEPARNIKGLITMEDAEDVFHLVESRVKKSTCLGCINLHNCFSINDVTINGT